MLALAKFKSFSVGVEKSKIGKHDKKFLHLYTSFATSLFTRVKHARQDGKVAW